MSASDPRDGDASPAAQPAGLAGDPHWAERYEVGIGLVLEARLRTTTKAFCNCATSAAAVAAAGAGGASLPSADAACPVCLGAAGTLPALNARALTLAVRAALAFGADVKPVSAFARAHGWSPARPRGYRLVQAERPLAVEGAVPIGETPEGAPLRARLVRFALGESDGTVVVTDGRVHVAAATVGHAVLRIASDDELRSSAEAVACARMVRQFLRAVGASDAEPADDSLRLVARVRVRTAGGAVDGRRVTLVGIDGFSALRAALDAEIARQCALRDAGGKLADEVRRWDPATATTVGDAAWMERAGDGPLLADPDLPPLVLDPTWVDAERDALPELPHARLARIRSAFELDAAVADALGEDVELAGYFESVARLHGDARRAAHWVLGPLRAASIERSLPLDALAVRVRPADLAALLDRLRDGAIDADGAERAFERMTRTGEPPARALERLGLDAGASR